MTLAVSACLLGEMCRYDGASKGCAEIMALGKEHTLIPFCPEAPVLGTPRGRISVIERDGVRRLLRDEDGMDVTDAIMAVTEAFIQSHPNIDRVILKSKSPSCGLGTTPMLDEDKEMIGLGNGLAAEYLIECGLQVWDENNFKKENECWK
ncbi:MAG: DUF523 domain-containing protein [Sulfuricurvum sp.]|jgi:uncharacterized protein YbbK (DUF523 family)|uniref:DUF523 domain-containing protein n=1 Tax=Sulfuricurvum sp. TaxID=2025608 RepID=UPI0025FD0DE0|nr:DUF523 domain-containing protein [Sulfuricurvum sp.]MCK9371677.1 DUF523 domain-containing protein [Sulfuricurvum sp.]